MPYKKNSDTLLPKKADTQEHPQAWPNLDYNNCRLTLDNQYFTTILKYTIQMDRIRKVDLIDIEHKPHEHIKLDTDIKFTDYDFTRSPLHEVTIVIEGEGAITLDSAYPEPRYEFHVDDSDMGQRLANALRHAQDICQHRTKTSKEPF